MMNESQKPGVAFLVIHTFVILLNSFKLPKMLLTCKSREINQRHLPLLVREVIITHFAKKVKWRAGQSKH